VWTAADAMALAKKNPATVWRLCRADARTIVSAKQHELSRSQWLKTNRSLFQLHQTPLHVKVGNASNQGR